MTVQAVEPESSSTQGKLQPPQLVLAGEQDASPLPSPSQAMANALTTPLKATASTASLGAASVGTTDSAAAAADGGSAGKGAADGRVHIEGLESGGFDYLRTTARARRDLCSLLLRLMQVKATWPALSALLLRLSATCTAYLQLARPTASPLCQANSLPLHPQASFPSPSSLWRRAASLVPMAPA